MEKLIKKFENKLYKNELVEKDSVRFGAIDAEIVWNVQETNPNDDILTLLKNLFKYLHINSILFAKPSEPYRTVIKYLVDSCHTGFIYPQDSETRTFLHDLRFVKELSLEPIVEVLKIRKAVIIKDVGLITIGTVSPEQCFVVFSSVCFACFVKFFSDYISLRTSVRVKEKFHSAFEVAFSSLTTKSFELPSLLNAPFSKEEHVYKAIEEAGLYTVEYKLVDSYFGNISYLYKDTIYISQTGSSLDELAGLIDACPLDGSTCTAITASSEFPSHRRIMTTSNTRAILHGHPRFAVIMSLYCEQKKKCAYQNECHTSCPNKRYVENIPIIPGEVGSGPKGLCNTLPEAIKQHPGAIVYGHGVFTTGKRDFNEAFAYLFAIENICINEFLERLAL